MSIRIPQNPAIGGIDELTADEEAFLQNLEGLSYAQGDILYHNGTNLTRLAAGTSGQFLKTNGAGANPEWAAGAGGGSGSMTTVKESGVQVGGSDIVTLDFGSGFDISESPDTEINISLDFSEVAGHDSFTDYVAGEHFLQSAIVETGTVTTGTWDSSFGSTAQENIEDIAGAMFSGNTESLITATYQDGDGTIDLAVEPNLSNYTNDAGFITATLTEEEVEDFVGGMVTGNTETGISVTYQDGDGTLDFVVSDLTVAGDSGSTGMTPGDTLTIAGGEGVDTSMSGDTLTIAGEDSSTTNKGIVELATAAETTTGTDTTRVVTPDAFAGSDFGIRYIQAIITNFTSDTATGDGQFYLHVPAGMDGMNLVEVHAEVITAGTTGTTDIQIHNVDNALDMLSTKLTIDSGETGSDTAATAAVINTSNDHVNEHDVVRIDVDAVSTTPAQGLIVTLGFQLP
jgi:hypothetical protein